jgi:hypothetical protein
MIQNVQKFTALMQKMRRDSNHKKRLGRIGVLIVFFIFLPVAYSAEEDAHVHGQESTTAGSEHMPATNDVCPVMPDMKVNPAIFTDYEGKRVYFCCNNCHEGPRYELTLAGFIKPVGITTLSLLVLTVAAALLRRRKPKLLFKWHKRLGITTLVSAIIHLILVLIAH